LRPLVPVTVTTAVSSSPWLPLDIYLAGSYLTLDVVITGTCTAQVDYTDDDIFNPAITPVVAGQAVASGSTSSVVHLPWIPRAVRLTVTAVTGGSATLKVIQQGAR